jgi:hypothetical protein
VTRIRFRQHSGLSVAGLVGFFGAVPLATARWYLAPILVVPIAVAVWAWRSGTDADAEGITIRALLGHRRLPWTRVAGFVPRRRAVTAILNGGGAIRLPAVTPADLPRLIEAGGRHLTSAQ